MSLKVTADPAQRATLLTALYEAEEQYGHLSHEALSGVSEQLSLSPTEVYSTASFYKLFKTSETGKYVLQVCEGLSCYLADGAEQLVDYLKEKLSIEVGGTTADGFFTLEVVPCLASCGTSPAVRVNDRLHDNLTLDKVDALIEGLRGK